MLDVRQCQFDDLAQSPSFSALCAEYADECHLDGLPSPAPQVEIYQRMEAVTGDMFAAIGAFNDGELVGALIMVMAVLPHYGAKFATVESYFVANNARRRGAGFLLLSEAERIARERGALALFVSTKVGSKLAEIMPKRKGYTNTNMIFMRTL